MPQSVQAALPMLSLYFPAGQRMHVLPSCPEAPALHLQFVSSAEPAAEFEFAGQI